MKQRQSHRFFHFHEYDCMWEDSMHMCMKFVTLILLQLKNIPALHKVENNINIVKSTEAWLDTMSNV